MVQISNAVELIALDVKVGESRPLISLVVSKDKPRSKNLQIRPHEVDHLETISSQFQAD